MIMKHTIVSYLEQLELLPLETKIYLTLLETGAMTARELTRKLGTNRTSVYPPIDSLIEKELIMKMVKESETKFAVTEPKESLPALLDRLVKRKLNSLKTLQAEFPTIVKVIDRSHIKNSEVADAEIKYYKGKTGVKKIYEEALQAKELRSYVSIEEITRIFPENVQLFDNAFKQNPTMKMFEIVENSPQAKKRFETIVESEQYFYKFLPKDMKFAPQDMLIYDDKVAIIHFKNKVSGVVLCNIDLYTNFKLLFDYMWKTLPSHNH